MRRNLVQCSVVSTYDTAIAYTKNEDFNSGGTGGFTANTGTVSNPTGNQLHMTANWASKPFATTSVYLVNGRSYTLNLDIVGFSVVSGFSHTVRVRVVLPGAAFNTDFTTTGTKTITFTSNTTGYVNIEIRSIISPPTGVYSGNPYIDIDNFKVSWDSAFTSSDTICVSKSGYKYGFNGMEKVDEISGEGNGYDFGARMYDGRLGRWFSVDPSFDDFEDFSPYCFSESNPIVFYDSDGEWAIWGALISASVEIVGQKLSGKSWSQIDWTDVAVSAGTGFVSGPVSSVSKFVKIYKAINKGVKIAKKYQIDEIIKAGVDNFSINTTDQFKNNFVVALSANVITKKYGSKIAKFVSKRASDKLKYLNNCVRSRKGALTRATQEHAKAVVDNASEDNLQRLSQKVTEKTNNLNAAYQQQRVQKSINNLVNTDAGNDVIKTTYEVAKTALTNRISDNLNSDSRSNIVVNKYLNSDKTSFIDTNGKSWSKYTTSSGKQGMAETNTVERWRKEGKVN